MQKITLLQWNKGMDKVAVNKLLRNKVGLSLKEAKQIVDQLLNDDTPTIQVISLDVANDIVINLAKLGVTAKL